MRFTFPFSVVDLVQIYSKSHASRMCATMRQKVPCRAELLDKVAHSVTVWHKELGTKADQKCSLPDSEESPGFFSGILCRKNGGLRDGSQISENTHKSCYSHKFRSLTELTGRKLQRVMFRGVCRTGIGRISVLAQKLRFT